MKQGKGRTIKWATGTVQAIQHLPSKHEAPSSTLRREGRGKREGGKREKDW
jgi:hypothetical protein